MTLKTLKNAEIQGKVLFDSTCPQQNFDFKVHKWAILIRKNEM